MKIIFDEYHRKQVATSAIFERVLINHMEICTRRMIYYRCMNMLWSGAIRVRYWTICLFLFGPMKCCYSGPKQLTHWGRGKWPPFCRRHFQIHFLERKVWISIKVSLKFVPKGPINNIPSLVQIMAWRLPGDKPLSEPMMVKSLMHLCVTRLQWVNSGKMPHVSIRSI